MGVKVSENDTFFVTFKEQTKWIPKDPVPCRRSPDLWGEVKKGQSHRTINECKRICLTQCPVVIECLEQALIEEGTKGKQYRFGIRGGLGAKERHAIYVERNPPPTV